MGRRLPVGAYVDAATFEQAVVRSLSEKRWQDEQVIGTRKQPGILLACGFELEFIYHTHDARLSQKGFPDVVAIRLRDGCITLAFLELKRWDKEPTDEQQAWLTRLELAARVVNLACGGKVRMVVGWYRPQDRERLLEDVR